MTIAARPVDRLRGALGVPAYPMVIVVTFVTRFWLGSTLDSASLLRPTVVALALAAAMTVLAIAATRDVDVGATAAGIAVVGMVAGDDPRVILLTPVAIAVLLLIAVRARSFERPIPWVRVTATLNVFAVCLLGLVWLQAAQTLATVGPTTLQSVVVQPRSAAAPPDIIVILLDEHGRQDILASEFGEDISGFVDALEDQGLHVSPRSRSNYLTTQMTLTSMFNMAHLGDLDLPSGKAEYAAAIRSRLSANRGFDALRSAGYRIGVVPPGFDGLIMRTADRVLDGGQLTDFETALIENSSVGSVLDAVAPQVPAEQRRARVRWNLDPSNWLPQTTGDPGLPSPYYLFVHVPSPHPPYVFDRDGNPIDHKPVVVPAGFAHSPATPAAAKVREQAYADQLAYVDRLAVETVRRIVESTPPSTIVIVMSDHGPAADIDWNHPTPSNASPRFSNFFAARTPGADGLFGDAPTPVNLLPTLLNWYVGADLELQPDETFLGDPPLTDLIEIGSPDAATR